MGLYVGFVFDGSSQDIDDEEFDRHFAKTLTDSNFLIQL